MMMLNEGEVKINDFYSLLHKYQRVILFLIVCMLPISLFAKNNSSSDTQIIRGNKKLQGRQLVVEAEKPGKYRIGILVFPGIDVIAIENKEERLKKKREVHGKVIQALSGKISLYDFHYRTLFNVVMFPSHYVFLHGDIYK
ncbi:MULTISPECIES: hypothetical protein [unclassified Symbiopectobacterium]|uniref:hypothetical protein n=1 Tax=unclassified Symbiopectobacterium TaxID=2794573 RepID=UPI002225C090|nr:MULTISPECIES: hypothetical protein [unclassified Symbiopectobacterium]MCW2475157.1 hypothetical protein [Candidatus Symbiopectobacterium sp. NZEC151]MCW2482952.1 hypothetical protein [Candidatus Symbiopectobacterium sp. NZEC135]